MLAKPLEPSKRAFDVQQWDDDDDANADAEENEEDEKNFRQIATEMTWRWLWFRCIGYGSQP